MTHWLVQPSATVVSGSWEAGHVYFEQAKQLTQAQLKRLPYRKNAARYIEDSWLMRPVSPIVDLYQVGTTGYDFATTWTENNFIALLWATAAATGGEALLAAGGAGGAKLGAYVFGTVGGPVGAAFGVAVATGASLGLQSFADAGIAEAREVAGPRVNAAYAEIEKAEALVDRSAGLPLPFGRSEQAVIQAQARVLRQEYDETRQACAQAADFAAEAQGALQRARAATERVAGPYARAMQRQRQACLLTDALVANPSDDLRQRWRREGDTLVGDLARDAERARSDADAGREQIQGEIERVLVLEAAIERTSDLASRIAMLRTSLPDAQGVAADRATVERVLAELAEAPRLVAVARMEATAARSMQSVDAEGVARLANEIERRGSALLARVDGLRTTWSEATAPLDWIGRARATLERYEADLAMCTPSTGRAGDLPRIREELQQVAADLEMFASDMTRAVEEANACANRAASALENSGATWGVGETTERAIETSTPPVEVEDLVAQAQRLIAGCRYAAALALMDRIMEADPSNGWVAQHYRTTIEMDRRAREVAVKLAEGLEDFNSGYYDSANGALTEALALANDCERPRIASLQGQAADLTLEDRERRLADEDRRAREDAAWEAEDGRLQQQQWDFMLEQLRTLTDTLSGRRAGQPVASGPVGTGRPDSGSRDAAAGRCQVFQSSEVSRVFSDPNLQRAGYVVWVVVIQRDGTQIANVTAGVRGNLTKPPGANVSEPLHSQAEVESYLRQVGCGR